MASSNRNWPSMFKSKPCNTRHLPRQHDINSSLMSAGCHRASCTTVPGCEERSPEPKPRWNPKPEQIRILEAIFNSGMVNPPREEIQRIRTQLQEYGQVGDANVFYWFQNRKSRSKHKLRHLQNSKQQSQQTKQNPQFTSVATSITAPSSSSSSSENSSPSTGPNKTLSLSSPNVIDVSISPTGSVNQTYFQAHNGFLTEPFFFPIQQTGGGIGLTEGFGFSELSNVVQTDPQQLGPCTSFFLSEILNHGARMKEQEDTIKMQPQLNYTSTSVPSIFSVAPCPLPANTATVPSTINQIQAVGESDPVGHDGPARSTVFINDLAIEVAAGSFNVREAFGEDAVLINSSGQPVLTNEWGVTLQSLNHGAFYYLVRTLGHSHVFSSMGALKAEEAGHGSCVCLH